MKNNIDNQNEMLDEVLRTNIKHSLIQVYEEWKESEKRDVDLPEIDFDALAISFYKKYSFIDFPLQGPCHFTIGDGRFLFDVMLMFYPEGRVAITDMELFEEK